MLRLRNVTKTYRSGNVLTTALDSIDLQICKGEYVAVVGPSGCGKTTLLSVLGLLDPPNGGVYEFEGQSVVSWSERKLAALRSSRIGFIFQSFNLLDELTVQENVSLAAAYSRLPRRDQEIRVGSMLERLGIAHRARHRPSQLSGGQQQRAAIARALVTEPALLLADEPTGNLDSVHGAEVMQILREINRAGTTLVMVTHSSAHAAQASRTLRMLDGRVVGDSGDGDR